MGTRIQDPECRWVASRLPALPDGSLEATTLRRLETHLVECEPCAREAAAFCRISALVRDPQLRTEQLPSGAEFAAAVLQCDREVARSRWSWWPVPPSGFWRWTAALALSSFAILAGIKLPRRTTVPLHEAHSAVAVERLPMLVVIDDERSGREVMVAR